MRVILGLTILICCAANMHGAEVRFPKLLTDARDLNNARENRIRAEIALEELIFAARQSLFSQGHAAPLELESSSVRLVEFRALQTQVRVYGEFITEMFDAEWNEMPTDRAGKRRMLVVHPPAGLSGELDCVAWLVRSSTELEALSEGIAVLKGEAKGELESLEAEIAYQGELVRRLRAVDDGCLSLRREIELAELRLSVLIARNRMGQAQQRYEVCRERLHQNENWIGLPVELSDGEMECPSELMVLLETRWRTHRLKARREAIIQGLASQAAYCERLAQLEHAMLSRPGELWQWQKALEHNTRKLVGVDRQLSELSGVLAGNGVGSARRSPQTSGPNDARLLRFVRAKTPAVHGISLRLDSAIAASRERIRRLEWMVNEPAVTNELERARLELAVLEAERCAAREEHAVWADVARSLEYDSGPNVRNVAIRDGQDPSHGSRTCGDLVSTCRTWLKGRVQGTGKETLADRRIDLLEWKLKSLRPLKRMGYATWKEVAGVERDLGMAQAHARAVRKERRVADLEYQRLLEIRDGRESDSHVVTRAR